MDYAQCDIVLYHCADCLRYCALYPFAALWDPTVPAHRIDQDDVILVCSSFNIAIDVAILIMPMPELRILQITMKQKLQITLFFLLGGL